MCLCVYVREDETIPGSVSHKADIIKGKNDFKTRVESWLADVGPPGGGERESFWPDAVDDRLSGVCERGVQNELPGVDESVNDHVGASGGAGRNRSISGSCRSSTSSRSSSVSRLKESRVKVHLAQLALRHEEERQREEEESSRRKEIRRNEEAEERRRQARREKQRQLELANAELAAWEPESACSTELLPKVTATHHDLVGESTAHSTHDAPATFDQGYLEHRDRSL